MLLCYSDSFEKQSLLEANCRAGALQSQAINLVIFCSFTEDFPVSPGNGLSCVKLGQGLWGRNLGLRKTCGPKSIQGLQGEPKSLPHSTEPACHVPF